MAETWLRVPSFPGYIVSSAGRIRHSRVNAPILKGSLDKDGYRRVCMHGCTIRLHTIVCETFNGPAPTKSHEVCHIDGDKGNNAPSNLRWGTRTENTADAIRHGTFFSSGDVSGERHPNAKLSAEQVAELRSMRGSSQRSLARLFGISQTQVCHILQGKRWSEAIARTQSAIK